VEEEAGRAETTKASEQVSKLAGQRAHPNDKNNGVARVGRPAVTGPSGDGNRVDRKRYFELVKWPRCGFLRKLLKMRSKFSGRTVPIISVKSGKLEAS
jgi:hypothetical protein